MARDLNWLSPAANTTFKTGTKFLINGNHAIATGPSSAFIALQFSDDATDDANDPIIGNWDNTPGPIYLETQPQPWDRQDTSWQVQNAILGIVGEVYVRAAVWATFTAGGDPVGNPLHWSQPVRLHRGLDMARAFEAGDSPE